MPRRDSQPDDLAWEAFQYALGELSPAQEAAFETRLADDPDACAAVAEAVALIEAARRCGPIRALRRRRLVLAAGTLLGAAAAVLAGFSLLLQHDADRSPAGGATPSAAVALAWSAVRDDAPVVAEIPEPDVNEIDEADSPSWMAELAVLAQEADETAADPEARGGGS